MSNFFQLPLKPTGPVQQWLTHNFITVKEEDFDGEHSSYDYICVKYDLNIYRTPQLFSWSASICAVPVGFEWIDFFLF